jgi:hypothetical protein
MALADIATEDPTPESVRADILKGLWQWNNAITSPTEIKKWDVYFQYYTTECRKAIGPDRGEHVTVRTHADIVEIAKVFANSSTKKDITQSLLPLDTQQRSAAAMSRMAKGSVELVARLVSMVEIGPIPYSVQVRAPLPWDNEDSKLDTLLAQNFPKSTQNVNGVKFDHDFTGFKFQQYGGFKIRWTNNLADHLRLMDNDTTLCIFHHVTFLKDHNRFDDPPKLFINLCLTVVSTFFPTGLAEETLQTLALLFPCNDKNTLRWLSSEKQRHDSTTNLDPELLKCDRIALENCYAEKFEFWRDELMTLKAKFEEPRHASIGNLWWDDRKKVPWYTFWIAVLALGLTVFFGLVQSIEGAIQVYKAYHPTPS